MSDPQSRPSSPFVGLSRASLFDALGTLTLEQMASANVGLAALFAVLATAFLGIGTFELFGHPWRAFVFVAFGLTLVVSSTAFLMLSRRIRALSEKC